MNMFDLSSRYAICEDASIITSGGRKIIYKKRRFLPPTKHMNVIHEFKVVAGDRLDQISARVLGDPLQFWRICDANDILHPLELTEEPGKRIRIIAPW
jgi:hypothetical protein